MIYAKIGESLQQIGGECPDGFIVMQSQRPDGDFIAEADGTWVNPNKLLTLAELQDQAWSRIKTERDLREEAGAPYLGKILDSDEKSVTRISIAVQAAQAAISAGTSFSLDWTMQDNSVVTMTAAEVVGMSVALATHSNGLHLAARAVHEKILAATDAAGVEAAEAAMGNA